MPPAQVSTPGPHSTRQRPCPQAIGPAQAEGLLYGVPHAQGWYPALLPGEEFVVELERKRLPAPTAQVSQRAFEAPRSEHERVLAQIWQDVLGVEPVGA